MFDNISLDDGSRFILNCVDDPDRYRHKMSKYKNKEPYTNETVKKAIDRFEEQVTSEDRFTNVSDMAVYICFYDTFGTNEFQTNDIKELLYLCNEYEHNEGSMYPKMTKLSMLCCIYSEYKIDKNMTRWFMEHLLRTLHGFDNLVIPKYLELCNIYHVSSYIEHKKYLLDILHNRDINELIVYHLSPLYHA